MLRCDRNLVEGGLEVGILRMLMYFVSGPPWWPRRVVPAAGRLAASSRAGLSKLREIFTALAKGPSSPHSPLPQHHFSTPAEPIDLARITL